MIFSYLNIKINTKCIKFIFYFFEETIIIKRDWQCKAGRERLTPYQSEDPNPTTPTLERKKRKGEQ